MRISCRAPGMRRCAAVFTRRENSSAARLLTTLSEPPSTISTGIGTVSAKSGSASREHARFRQTDADVASFDGGFGSAYLARQVGQKFAREIFFLGDTYTADDAHRMGMVNAVVDHADLEAVGLEWARKIMGKSPTAQRMLKFAFNLIDDGLMGQQVFAGEATRLAYGTAEAEEGRDAFLERRDPDWSPYPWHY